jgi:hypothetical protein
MKDDFRITLQGNFQVRFANGVQVSVFIGKGAYIKGRGENQSFYMSIDDDNSNRESPNAEIAVFDKDDNYIIRKFKDDGDDVIGWQSPEQFLEILNWAKNYNG